jgi:hypothetical protein
MFSKFYYQVDFAKISKLDYFLLLEILSILFLVLSLHFKYFSQSPACNVRLPRTSYSVLVQLLLVLKCKLTNMIDLIVDFHHVLFM